MIIMISSEGESLQSQPSLRFGRSPYFIKYNLDSDAWECIQNKAVSESWGAGVAASQLMIDHHVIIVLSGRFGPNAFRALSSAGIKMFTFDASYQTVEAVIESYKKNELEPVLDMDKSK